MANAIITTESNEKILNESPSNFNEIKVNHFMPSNTTTPIQNKNYISPSSIQNNSASSKQVKSTLETSIVSMVSISRRTKESRRNKKIVPFGDMS